MREHTVTEQPVITAEQADTLRTLIATQVAEREAAEAARVNAERAARPPRVLAEHLARIEHNRRHIARLPVDTRTAAERGSGWQYGPEWVAACYGRTSSPTGSDQ